MNCASLPLVGFDGRSVYKDTQYDDLGRIARVTRDYYEGDTRYWAESQYDILGRVIRVSEPAANGSRYDITTTYNGLATTVYSGANRLSKTTSTNALGQTTRVDEELNTYTEYTYTSDVHLKTTRVNGDNATTITLEYDEFGRKVAMNDPNMGRWAYTCNGFGELTSQRDAKGQVVTMAYDRLGRMVTRQEAEGTSRWEYGSIHDAKGSIGQLLQESSPGIRHDYSYDTLGRLEAKTTTIDGQGSFIVDMSYDQHGRLKRTVYPGSDSLVTENIYNRYGYLSVVKGLRSDAKVLAQTQAQNNNAVTDTHNWVYCAGEWQVCALPAGVSASVRYGANDQFTVKTNMSGIVACNNLAFGDPLPYTAKTCSYQVRQSALPLQSGEWVHCAHESQTCTLPADVHASVLYGANSNFVINHNVSGNVTCNNFTFGDPLPYTEKACSYQIHQNQSPATTVVNINNSQGSGISTPEKAGWVNYWKALDMDASGRVRAEVYGNGIVNNYHFNEATGNLETIDSGLLSFNPIRRLDYEYDTYKNVTLRNDRVNDIRETFNYDRLDRLTKTEVSSNKYTHSEFNKNDHTHYDAFGNITSKTDVGKYTYGQHGAGPNAVTYAAGRTYRYDTNGNMINGNGRSIQWSSYNKPTHITRQGLSAAFKYGARSCALPKD